jgi:glycosyltransferase involved in cell wall biosynthesis
MGDIIALVPAFNEADTIAATVEAIRAIPTPRVTRVIVIDDGSADMTAACAKEAGAEVVRCKKNGGKGAALTQGVAAITSLTQGVAAIIPLPQGVAAYAQPPRDADSPTPTSPATHQPAEAHTAPDIVLLLDGDLGDSAREAQALLHPVVDGLADMTIGILPKPPGSGGFGVVKNLARSAIRDWGGGYDAQAPLSGQRALTWECLQAVLPFAEGYGVEVALTIRALQQDYRVFEVMVDMRHRATGRDIPGFLHRARQYLDVRRTITHLTK